jgi:hypothetical protein
MLWWFADYFSILHCHLTLQVAHWLRRWVLWTTTCPISGSGLSPACWRPFCLSCLCLLKVCREISSLLPPLLQCAFSNSSLLLCVSFQFLFYFSVFFFFAWGMGVSLPWRPCWFILGVAGRIPCDAWCSPVGLLNVSQAGLEPATGGAGALLVSQCNVALRSFSQVRDSGCWSFDSPYCFISAKCGSSISVRFWSHGAHAVCFWALDAILDLLLFIF